jgi:hypothetical protein
MKITAGVTLWPQCPVVYRLQSDGRWVELASYAVEATGMVREGCDSLERFALVPNNIRGCWNCVLGGGDVVFRNDSRNIWNTWHSELFVALSRGNQKLFDDMILFNATTWRFPSLTFCVFFLGYLKSLEVGEMSFFVLWLV